MRAAMAEWLHAPVLETQDLRSIVYLASLISNQDYIKFSNFFFRLRQNRL